MSSSYIVIVSRRCAMLNRHLVLIASLFLSSVAACSDEEELVPDADSDVVSDVSDGSGGDVAPDSDADATETDPGDAPDGSGTDAGDVDGDLSEDAEVADAQTDATDAADALETDAQNDAVQPDDTTGDTDAGSPVVPTGDCTSDDDCFDGVCLPINGIEGGWKSCQIAPFEAEFCPDPGGAFESECCNSTECNGGAGSICVRGPLFYCGGAFPGEYNLCATPACATNTDCAEGNFCLDGGFYGEPAAVCAPGGCATHADCTDGPDGQCRPFFTECGNRFDGLHCTYADSACRSSADCPPAEGFPQVCQWDIGAGESVCIPSIPRP